jgi:mannosyltransferase OCH1-like enzyme
MKNIFLIGIIVLLAMLVLYIYVTTYSQNNNNNNNNNNNIPKIITLCNKTKETKDIPEYIVKNWQILNPDYQVQIYDDIDCKTFLMKNFGSEYVDIFNFIKDGPIKCDFWRCCKLYIDGGVYSDIDVKPVIPIKDFLEKDVEFLTCVSHETNNMNPHFIICPPLHPVNKKAIDTYVNFYRSGFAYSYWGWSIVYVYANIFNNMFGKSITEEGVYTYKSNSSNEKYQFLKEIKPNHSREKPGNPYDVYCTYKNQIVLYNRYSDYDSDLHSF